MKRSLLLIPLFLTLFLLSACAGDAQGPGDGWTVYHVATDTLVNPNFPPYSFEYPSYWKMEEGVNHIAFASESKLLKDPPEKLKPGQIIVALSINKSMPPEEMVETYTSSLGSMIEFQEPVAVRLNGRAAIYQQGTNPETGDLTLVLAVDMGDETRGLLSARVAEGEFEKWEEVLFKMAGSLKVET